MKVSTIETVSSIKAHPTSDKLEICQIKGWQVVVKKNIHTVKDKVVFIQIDSVLPDAPWIKSLKIKSPIVKMSKIKGEYSAGLVLPLSVFPDHFLTFEEGTDVGSLLGVLPYVKEDLICASNQNIGEFPTHIATKTDEYNGLQYLDVLSEVIKTGSITITQKLHGSPITIIVENGKITHVCSGDFSKADIAGSVYWNIARQLNIAQGFSGVIQGQLFDTNINGNCELTLYVSQLKKNSGEYMNYQEMKGYCYCELQCRVVPLVSEMILDNTDIETTICKFQEIADQQHYDSPDNPVEGIIVRCSDYRTQPTTGSPLGFKILNRNYKAKGWMLK